MARETKKKQVEKLAAAFMADFVTACEESPELQDFIEKDLARMEREAAKSPPHQREA